MARPYQELQSYNEVLHSAENKEWEAFHKQLEDVPHTFLMEDQEQISQDTHRRLKHVLESDLEFGLKTALETARTHNLLGYVLFRLDEPHQALKATEKALKEENECYNLVSLANMAVIKWQLGRRMEAERIVRQIRGMQSDPEAFDYQYLVVKAKAELAFTYTRRGPSFTGRAAELFSDVIAQAREPEKWLWVFGKALALRRYLHVQFVPILCDADIEKLEAVRTLRLFLDVIGHCQCPTLKAKAYVEVALLLRMSWQEQIGNILAREAQVEPLEACERALQLDDTDSSVLWKSGKLYRYAKDFDRARDLLEKAIQNRSTTTEYHQLGLVYKSLANRCKYSRRHSGQRRGGRTRHHEGTGRGGAYRARAPQGRGLDFGQGRNYGRSGARFREDRGRGRGAGSPSGPCWQTDEPFQQGERERGRGGNFRQRNRGGRGWSGRGYSDWASERSRMPSYTGGSGNRGRDYGAIDRGGSPYAYPQGANRQEEWTQPTGAEQNRPPAGASEATAAAGEEAAVSADSLVTRFSGLSLSIPPLDQHHLSQETSSLTLFGAGSSHGDDGRQAASPRQSERHPDLLTMKKMIKSPTKETTSFSWSDRYVDKSVECLEKAVEISQRDNTRAIYDLALMYRALGELDRALRLLEEILKSTRNSVGPFDKVTAYEQAGLILKEMSEVEEDESEKRELEERAKSKLTMAVLTATRLYCKMPKLPGMVKDVWQSFYALLKAADRSERSPHEKVREKAKLFKLIKDHKHSIKLLRIVEGMAPDERENPDHLKLLIENYVGEEDYEQALTFVEMLQGPTQSRAITDLFEDKHYLLKVYIHAAKQALVTASIPSQRSRLYFHSAFTDVFTAECRVGDSSSEESTITDDEGDDENESWDVMIIHDEIPRKAKDSKKRTKHARKKSKTVDSPDTENSSNTADISNMNNTTGQTLDTCETENTTRKTTDVPDTENAARGTSDDPETENTARKTIDSPQIEPEASAQSFLANTDTTVKVLTHILKDICGLRVTSMAKHVLPNRQELEGVAHVMQKSRVVLVLAGSSRISDEFRFYIDMAAMRPSTVVLLVHGDHVPAVLKTRKVKVFPQELMACGTGEESNGTQGEDQFSKDTVKLICDLFSFLIDLEGWSLLG